MAVVIVEREFEEPVVFEDLQAREDAAAWCLEAHGVRHLRTYWAADGRRSVCVYEARDAESVRRSQRQAELPFTRVWTADHHVADGA